MSLIQSIRNFLRLDKVSVSVSTEFADSVGLWINERNELMKDPGSKGCVVVAHNTVVPDPHHDHPFHLPQDFHFLHL